MNAASPAGTVLVVDDHKGNRHLSQLLLKAEGYVPVLAANINEALEALERQPIDLIVADVRMPGGTGFELFERTRRYPDARFLLMTATLRPEDRERAEQMGVRLAERPIDPDDFIALIRTALAKA